MSFDRRWLMTASAAAFFGALFRKAEAAPPAPGAGPAATGAKTPEDFIVLFGKGWPRKPDQAESAVIDMALRDVYLKRFNARFPKMSPAEKAHLEGFAQNLGTVTYACLENNRKGTCGWDAEPNVKLRREHVDAARELLGYYLNLPPEKRCDPNATKVTQAEEPCPLCLLP